MLNPANEAFAAGLREIIAEDVFRPMSSGYADQFLGGAAASMDNLVLAPATTEDVSKIVRACADAMVGIVPYSGGTGLVGGHVWSNAPAHVVLSLERMNRIRDVFPSENSIVVEAGVLLHTVQKKALEVDRLFPLSMASEGSARIGGVLGTNAGGVNVVRYGNARDLCLGIEAVMADGTILNGLTRLRKDNTGYDLRHLLIGSEGTLAVITAAALRLFPRPRAMAAAIVAVPGPAAALELLAMCSRKMGTELSAFELISGVSATFQQEAGLHTRLPFEQVPDWMVLVDVGGGGQSVPTDALEEMLSEAMESELVFDGAISQSEQQRADFWTFREQVPEANRKASVISNHDISLPLSKIPEFLETAAALVGDIGDFRINCVGHMGDGNLHYGIFPPKDTARSDYDALAGVLKRGIHDLVVGLGGSISAEHGIGRNKVAELERYSDPTKLRLIKTLKSALDPKGILNPGAVVFASAPE